MKQRIAFALIMGIITTGLISFILITVNIGLVGNFMKIWLKSWSIAYVIAIPAILLIAPRIQYLVDKWFADADVKNNEL